MAGASQRVATVKTRPIEPAGIDFDDGGHAPPRSRTYGDIYHPAVGAWAQARHVFLQGNDLPARWRGCERHVVLETGFGLGNNFLATWQAWQDDPARCGRLHYVAIERHPPALHDLRRAHAAGPAPALAARLLQHWPELTPNLHVIDGLDDESRVQLTLAFGDIADLLPALRLHADSFFLDGHAPASNPAMWDERVLRALGRRAAPGATLATWSVAACVRDGLRSAGFGVEVVPGIGGKREVLRARWAGPRGRAGMPLRDAIAPPAASAPRSAVVVGAGLAGAAAAQALARLGVAVTVVERRGAPAQEASGNVAGLLHGTVHPDDGPHARLFRAAALQAQRDLAPTLARDPSIGCLRGLLRIDARVGGVAAMQALLDRQRLPAGHLQALPRDAAAALAGVALPRPAWWYAGGGWLAPGAWAVQALNEAGVRVVTGVDVASLGRTAGGWALLDAAGGVVAEAPVVVVANAAAAPRLLATADGVAERVRWPLTATQGQVSVRQEAGPGRHALRLPVAGDGYAIALLDGTLLCGATRHAGAVEAAAAGAPAVDDDDHAHNRQRLARLTGLDLPGDGWQARAGWRVGTDDRLPIAGALPCWPLPARREQARWLPREQGLFVLTALGSRGLTLAPLMARLVAAQATGTPWPVEQDLADAVDPARWIVRAARTGRDGGSDGG